MSYPVTVVGDAESQGPSFVSFLVYSFFFHVFVFVVVPLVSRLVWHEDAYGRPKTFQLVSMPRPVDLTNKNQPAREKVRPKEAVKKKEKTLVPKTEKKQTKPKEQVKEKEEDLSELENLLGGLQQPVSDINFGSAFNYSWYERNIMLKVEQNWKPPIQKADVFVILRFTIFSNGSVSEVTVKKSSGNSMVDNLAVRAVNLGAPFGKLPPGYDGDRLEIDYTLNTVVQ